MIKESVNTIAPARVKESLLREREQIIELHELVWDIMKKSLPKGAFFNKYMKEKEVSLYALQIRDIFSK